MTLLLGVNTVGTDGNDFEGGGATTSPLIGSKFVASGTGTVDNVTLRTNSANACNSVAAAIFSDNAGTPNANIGSVVTFALTTGVTAWQTSGGGMNAAVVSGTTYWIVFQSQTASNLTFSLHDSTTASGTKDTSASATRPINQTWAATGGTVGTFTELMNAHADSAGGGAGGVLALPVYLPRSLGPRAVGPPFFARFPPAAPGISPPPGGLPGIPVYLPRRLGPAAVGPPFFARFPVPAPGASAGPAAIWLPAATFPASRNRSSFFVVRGRQVKAVPNQETPIVEQRSPGVRREPPRLSRGARPFPVQPQIAVPPPVIGNRIDSQRGKITSVQRGRQWSVVPPQATVTLIWVPRQVPGHRRVILPSRGRVFAPVPAQVTVPVLVFPNRVDSQRSKLAALYRGKRWDVIPPQVVVVSVWIPTFISPNSTFY